MLKDKKIFVTGAAGFIGFHLCKRLLKEGVNLCGFDNLNDYYRRELKNLRLKEILKEEFKPQHWKFIKGELEDYKLLKENFSKFQPEIVIHLAAQAGVRYSITNPKSYISSNLVGFSNILECCKELKIKSLIYASSSSVYGGNTKIPFSEDDHVDHPVSLYAATKKSNELMAHAYSNLFNISMTGLRFFTVYGPWGRPDMAPMIFADAILRGIPIKIFNNGNMERDFTYIDDVVEGIYRCCNKPATAQNYLIETDESKSSSCAPHRVFNIGNGKPIHLLKFIEILEDSLGKKAIKTFLPMQPGDLKNTFADTSKLISWIDFRPATSIDHGIKNFSEWFKEYFYRK